jgi:hypothetical protein
VRHPVFGVERYGFKGRADGAEVSRGHSTRRDRVGGGEGLNAGN